MLPVSPGPAAVLLRLAMPGRELPNGYVLAAASGPAAMLLRLAMCGRKLPFWYLLAVPARSLTRGSHTRIAHSAATRNTCGRP
jgi:hypothetical protein